MPQARRRAQQTEAQFGTRQKPPKSTVDVLSHQLWAFTIFTFLHTHILNWIQKNWLLLYGHIDFTLYIALHLLSMEEDRCFIWGQADSGRARGGEYSGCRIGYLGIEGRTIYSLGFAFAFCLSISHGTVCLLLWCCVCYAIL